MSISLIYNFLQGVTTSNASTTTTMPPSPPNPPPLNTTLNQTPVATSRSSLTAYTTSAPHRIGSIRLSDPIRHFGSVSDTKISYPIRFGSVSDPSPIRSDSNRLNKRANGY